MSEAMFSSLGYKLQDEKKVIIIGINGKSEGRSVIIPNFEIGGVSLGRVRVAIGKVHEDFENSVILGVNILVWFNYAVLHHKHQIILTERSINTTVRREDRFISLYSRVLNITSAIATIGYNEQNKTDAPGLSFDNTKARMIGLQKSNVFQ